MATEFTFGDLNEWQPWDLSFSGRKRAADNAPRVADTTMCVIISIAGDKVIWEPVGGFPALETASTDKRGRWVTDARGEAEAKADSDISSQGVARTAATFPPNSSLTTPTAVGDLPTPSPFFLTGKFAIGVTALDVRLDFVRTEPIFEVPIKTLLLQDVIDFIGRIAGIDQLSRQMPCPFANALPLTLAQVSLTSDPCLVVDYSQSSVTLNITTTPIVNGDAILQGLAFFCNTNAAKQLRYRATICGIPIVDDYPFKAQRCKREPRRPDDPGRPFDWIADALKVLLATAAASVGLLQLASYGKSFLPAPITPGGASDLIKALKRALDETPGRGGESLSSCAKAVFAEVPLTFDGCLDASLAAGLAVAEAIVAAISSRVDTAPADAARITHKAVDSTANLEAWARGLVLGYGWSEEHIGAFMRAIAPLYFNKKGTDRGTYRVTVDMCAWGVFDTARIAFPSADFAAFAKGGFNGLLPPDNSFTTQDRNDLVAAIVGQTSRLFSFPHRHPWDLAQVLAQADLWPGMTAGDCWLAVRYGAEDGPWMESFNDASSRAAVARLERYSRTDLDATFYSLAGIGFGPDTRVEIAVAPKLQSLGSFTLVTWVKPVAISETQDIFGQHSDGEANMRLRIANAKYQFGNFRPTGLPAAVQVECNVPPGDVGHWNQIVTTCDEQFCKLYSNGTLLASAASVAGMLPSDAAPWLIGGTGDTHFRGCIESVRILYVALSESAVTAAFSGSIDKSIERSPQYSPLWYGFDPLYLTIKNPRWVLYWPSPNIPPPTPVVPVPLPPGNVRIIE